MTEELEDTIYNTPRHPNVDEIEDIWREGKRAKEIVQWLSDKGYPQINYTSLARYGQRNWSGKKTEKVTVTTDADYEEVTDLITDIGNQGGVVTKVVVDTKDAWGWEKQEDGTNEQVKRTTVARKVEYLPAEESVQLERAQVPDITIGVRSVAHSKPSKPGDWKLAVSMPDMQIGGHMDDRGVIEPTQDERAINVAFQMLLDMESEHGIDLIVNAGDNLDLPAFSTHRSAPGYTYTTQYAIDRYTTVVAAERAVAPLAKIVELPSNHVARMTNMIVDKVPALAGIRRGNTDEPLLSLAYLCRFEEYGVEYIDGWPDGTFWAAKNLRFVHGDATSGVPGATARKYLREGISTVYGHSHHSELLYLDVDNIDGHSSSFAGSAGCLCRTDGFLPSAKTGITAEAKLAAQKNEPWQQGIWFIWYKEDGSADPYVEPVKINNGKSIFRGKQYSSTVDKFGVTV